LLACFLSCYTHTLSLAVCVLTVTVTYILIHSIGYREYMYLKASMEVRRVLVFGIISVCPYRL
jgi:hypothetical protein